MEHDFWKVMPSWKHIGNNSNLPIMDSKIYPNLVSILLPSRQRGQMVLKSIKSLYDTATHPDKIQLLLKIDSDDIDSYIPILGDISKITNNNYKLVISDKLEGYFSLNVHYNDLCGVSNGEFLLLWNDDALMDTQDWDATIQNYTNKLCVIQTSNNHFPWIFPFIHTKLYELCGYLSPHFANDTWIHDFAQTFDIEVYEPNVLMIHDRYDVTGNNNDSRYVIDDYHIKYDTYMEEYQQILTSEKNRLSESIRDFMILECEGDI